MEQVIEGQDTIRTKGARFVSPFAIPALSGSMAACQVSMEYGLTGPVITQVAACASSVICFLDGLRLIQRGRGGRRHRRRLRGPAAEDGLRGALQHGCPVEAQRRAREGLPALRPRPRRLPLRRGRRGHRPRVARSTPCAAARRIQAEVIGAALTADAFHISAPEPTGRGAAMAMRKAIEDAGIAVDEVDYIVAHGTSTPLNDVTETRAIKAALGEHAYRVAISSPKSMVGHLLGAAGAVAGLVAIGAIRENVIPPTINLDNPDLPECDLDYVPRVARHDQGRHGHDQRLRLRRPERRRRLPPLRGLTGRHAPGRGPHRRPGPVAADGHACRRATGERVAVGPARRDPAARGARAGHRHRHGSTTWAT